MRSVRKKLGQRAFLKSRADGPSRAGLAVERDDATADNGGASAGRRGPWLGVTLTRAVYYRPTPRVDAVDAESFEVSGVACDDGSTSGLRPRIRRAETTLVSNTYCVDRLTGQVYERSTRVARARIRRPLLLGEPIRLRDMASRMHISERQLTRRFLETYGQTTWTASLRAVGSSSGNETTRWRPVPSRP